VIWTEKQTDQLRQLCESKLSASLIAKTMELTRNQIVGKSHREGYQLRGNEAGAQTLSRRRKNVAPPKRPKACEPCCDRCAELEEKVRQLEVQLYNREWEPPAEFNLSPAHSSVLKLLVGRAERIVSHGLIIDATRDCPGNHGDDVDLKLAQIHICHLRAKLRPFGLEIDTAWGRGYRLNPAIRHRLLNWEAERAAA